MQPKMQRCEICADPNWYAPSNTAHCSTCHLTWTGLAACHCVGCHLTFGSVTGFDGHLSGPPEQRHHATPDELRAKGWLLNDRGLWVTKSREGHPAYQNPFRALP